MKFPVMSESEKPAAFCESQKLQDLIKAHKDNLSQLESSISMALGVWMVNIKGQFSSLAEKIVNIREVLNDQR